MKKYCGKCGAEITGNAKFCPKCGATVGTVSVEEKESKKSPKEPKKAKGGAPDTWAGPNKIMMGIVVAIAVVAVIVVSVVLSGSSGAAYEKPLKAQVTGSNKGNEDKYVESFTEEGKEHFLENTSADDFKERAEDYKDMSYEVKNVEEGDIYDVWDDVAIRLYQMSDDEKDAWYSSIEEVKVVTVDFTYTYEDDEEPSVSELDYRMIKVDGKWYTIDSIY